MISLRSSVVKRIPKLKEFSIFSRTLMTKKFDTVEYSEDKKTAIYTTNAPFLPDRAGLIPVATVPQLSEVSDAFRLNNTTLLRKPALIFKENGLLVVLKTQRIKILPDFYKYMKTNNSISIHYRVRDVGKKSFSMENEIYNTTNVLLAKSIRTVVTCDLKMRPVPIPQQALELLIPYAKHKGRCLVPPPFTKKPNNVFITHVTPRPSDLDILYHVNQSNYITFMLDAAVHAAKAGVYNNLNQDIAYSSINQIIVSYNKELLLGENVKIETWEDEEDPLKVCFEMSVNSQLACQGGVLLREPLLELSPDIKMKFPRVPKF